MPNIIKDSPIIENYVKPNPMIEIGKKHNDNTHEQFLKTGKIKFAKIASELNRSKPSSAPSSELTNAAQHILSLFARHSALTEIDATIPEKHHKGRPELDLQLQKQYRKENNLSASTVPAPTLTIK